MYSRTTEGPLECEEVPFVWPEDSDERVPVVMMMSLNEYVVLSSTVDVGSDLAYAEDAIRVLRLWMHDVRCNVQICSLIIDCLLNDAETKQALIDTLAASQEFQDMIKQTSIRASEETVESDVVPEGCDNDELAGRVIRLVDVLDTNNTDFLQIVEVGTNDEERVAALIGAIPGLGVLPADEILDAFQRLLEDFTENYAAAVTLAWKNEVSEDLYCLAKLKEDCTLTFQDVFDYFNSRAGAELTIASLIKNVVQFVINGDFGTDNLVASGMYAIQLGFIVAGQDFYGLNIPVMSAMVRDASTSTAWEDWDECGEPPAGEWELEVYPGDTNGVIVSQTSNSVTFEATQSVDTLWRVNAFRPSGDPVISDYSKTGAALVYAVWGPTGGGFNAGEMSNGDRPVVFRYAATSGTFTVHFEW